MIVGHSERRQLFGETDEWVNRKVRAAIAAELTPIVCIGETLEERERDQTLDVLDRQIEGRTRRHLRADDVAALVIAYEPVWAIGTGKNATPAEADEAHAHIRGRLRQWFGGDAADAVPDSLRRLGEARQRRGAARACPTSTARSSAAPASTQSFCGDRAGSRPSAGRRGFRPTGPCGFAWRRDRVYTRCSYVLLVVGLYVLVCFLLLVVVLLQQGKGGDIAAAFGGVEQPDGVRRPRRRHGAHARDGDSGVDVHARRVRSGGDGADGWRRLGRERRSGAGLAERARAPDAAARHAPGASASRDTARPARLRRPATRDPWKRARATRARATGKTTTPPTKGGGGN